MSNKPKIIFHPGCFDNLDLTQEQLDEFVSMLEQAVEDGTLFENSREISEDDPMYQEIVARMQDAEDRKLQ